MCAIASSSGRFPGGNFAPLVGSHHRCRLVSFVRRGRHASQPRTSSASRRRRKPRPPTASRARNLQPVDTCQALVAPHQPYRSPDSSSPAAVVPPSAAAATEIYTAKRGEAIPADRPPVPEAHRLSHFLRTRRRHPPAPTAIAPATSSRPANKSPSPESCPRPSSKRPSPFPKILKSAPSTSPASWPPATTDSASSATGAKSAATPSSSTSKIPTAASTFPSSIRCSASIRSTFTTCPSSSTSCTPKTCTPSPASPSSATSAWSSSIPNSPSSPRKTGQPWRENGKLVWTDSSNPKVQDYNIALAKFVAQSGADEIQFDYVRFPAEGDQKDATFVFQNQHPDAGSRTSQVETSQVEMNHVATGASRRPADAKQGGTSTKSAACNTNAST